MALLGGAGSWWWLQPHRDAEAQVRDGRMLLDAEPSMWSDAAARADRAIALAPDLADAWGLRARALAERLHNLPNGDDPVAIRAALEDAAGRGLALTPGQADALAALAAAEPFFGTWHACDRRVAAVLSSAPGHRQALVYRDELLADCGRFREARQLLLPLAEAAAPMRLAVFRLLQREANLGNVAGMARWEAAAMQHWPSDASLPAVQVRAYLGLGAMEKLPPILDQISDGSGAWFPPGVAPVLREAAAAIVSGGNAARGAIADRAEAVAATRISAANFMMPLLSALGAVDAAFRVADALYRGRGPLQLPVTSPNGGSALYYQQIRRALPLFLPVAAAMRNDTRFEPLVRDIGLVAAWRAMGAEPDFIARQSAQG